ncbi:asparagine synthase-related protein [Kutzneria kofuensis]|uniref:asparagine synthase (glutamine-hydrolyzing) n=1 Tax=Kutzneria kofuensis TaxID=103725 RepID=A0A7W9KDL1_9PSEU|nr:asparagine synthase-related protein [Kutzneria kofuensis]MBB5889849.1 asparagine synthase (glutamine-hydrolyzing) [Kutzneria kofuensis]
MPTRAEAVLALLHHATRSVAYPSGRPWLVGSWPDDQIMLHVAGRSRVALIGHTSVSTDHLARLVERTGDVSALDTPLADMAGSCHVIADLGGRQRVQGTVSGVRRVFHAELDGNAVAADRADVLGWLIGAELNQHAVALSLLDPMRPHPLDDVPMWHGVTALPADRFLLVEASGRASTIRWWQPPAPVLPLREGARRLATALSDAVRCRLRGAETVSCDLSGGLDSMAVTFLAARGQGKLVAYTACALDSADDDLAWADRAVVELPGVVHDVLPRDQIPLVYDGIAGADDTLDEPSVGVIDRAKLLTGYRRMAANGSQLHLTGHGGDEVLEGAPSHLHSMLRTHPLRAVDMFRGFRARTHWPVLPTVLTALRTQPYSSWLSSSGVQLAGGGSRLRLVDLEWGIPPTLPPWVTPDAHALIRESFAAVAGSAAPLAGTRGRHADLAAIRGRARLVRSLAQLVAPTGTAMAAPFLDDRVIEACQSVRPHERANPWRHKPLLSEAMRGIVPTRLQGRNGKVDRSAEEEAGIRANRGHLLVLCEGSRLADLGFVDTGQLRAACRYSISPDRLHEPLQQTVACELWLRTSVAG